MRARLGDALGESGISEARDEGRVDVQVLRAALLLLLLAEAKATPVEATTPLEELPLPALVVLPALVDVAQDLRQWDSAGRYSVGGLVGTMPGRRGVKSRWLRQQLSFSRRVRARASHASATSLNFFAASAFGFLSGWNSSASFL